MMYRLLLVAFVMLYAFPIQAAQDVVNTLHNLSLSGPGTFKSLSIDRVCVFCHTPHNSSPADPLWNRQMSGANYINYDSTTLFAAPGQPTGQSRLCLSCHDGTVALGSFLNAPSGQTNDLQSTLLTGRGSLGTDLSDDHPISFLYDAALQGANGKLVHPAGIDLPLEDGQVQCTSCHDPHEKDLAPFLRKSTLNSQLCTTCHQQAGTGWNWNSSSHATSNATPSGATPWPERKPGWIAFTTVSEGGCLNCHTTHNATTPARLIKGEEENTCYLCHDGSVAAKNIQAEELKPYNHPVDVTPDPDHDAASVENPLTMKLHAECADCHNPHAVESAPPMVSFNPSSPTAPHTTAPAVNARLKGVKGIDINGGVKASADSQYEVCFKCHGVPGKSACGDSRCSTATSFSMTRQDGVYNIREKVVSSTPGLVSYHPIVSNNPSNNSEVPSLRTDIPLNRTSSLIYCTDCHSGDTSAAAGGSGPNGPHGSVYPAMLTQDYAFGSTGFYSSASYRLCFKCHDEGKILSDSSGFPHNRHLRRVRTSCITCHDPHGSARSQHLINFMTGTTAGGGGMGGGGMGGGAVSPVGGRAEPVWQDDGVYKGRCYLSCHGKTHNPKTY